MKNKEIRIIPSRKTREFYRVYFGESEMVGVVYKGNLFTPQKIFGEYRTRGGTTFVDSLDVDESKPFSDVAYDIALKLSEKRQSKNPRLVIKNLTQMAA